jgi:hypothetical protein
MQGIIKYTTKNILNIKRFYEYSIVLLSFTLQQLTLYQQILSTSIMIQIQDRSYASTTCLYL